jgi:hypothetical protein
LSKSWTRDLREFGFFGPNRELTNSTATCQCEKLLFQEVRTRRRAILCRRVGPCSRPAGLRVQTLPAARRYDSRGILRCQPLLDATPHLRAEPHLPG